MADFCTEYINFTVLSYKPQSAQSAKWHCTFPHYDIGSFGVRGRGAFLQGSLKSFRNFLSHRLIQDLLFRLSHYIPFFLLMIESVGYFQSLSSCHRMFLYFAPVDKNDASKHSWRRCQHQSMDHVLSIHIKLIRFLTALSVSTTTPSGLFSYDVFLVTPRILTILASTNGEPLSRSTMSDMARPVIGRSLHEILPLVSDIRIGQHLF